MLPQIQKDLIELAFQIGKEASCYATSSDWLKDVTVDGVTVEMVLDKQYTDYATSLFRTAEKLQETLRLHGFVPCNLPECNCGSWHQRYGLVERMQEITELLEEAGHPLSNDNGNSVINALKELVNEVYRLRGSQAKDEEM